MQVVQGLSKAAEKGAAKAEMKSKEATVGGVAGAGSARMPVFSPMFWGKRMLLHGLMAI